MKKWVMLLAVLAVGASGCKKSETATTVTPAPTATQAGALVESAVNEVGSQASSVDGSSISPMDYDSFAACAYSSARSSCASNSATVNWNGCTVGTATLTGIVTETYSGFGAVVCGLNGHQSTVKRVIDPANPRKITFLSGAHLATDMVMSTAFDGTTFPDASEGTSLQRLESGTSNGLTCSVSNGCYNLVIRGLHNTFTTAGGSKLAENYMTADVSYQGSKAGNNRVVVGTMSVWRETLGAKAVHTFDNVTWGNSSCCYPTSGSVTSTVTGAVAGTTTMTFSSVCGEASISVGGGTSESYTLTECTP